LLRLIHKHPIIGLLLALSLEAWMALPGEAMIAVAASSLATRAARLGLGFAKLAVGGVTGMVCNDLILFGLSRAGRGVLAQWIGLHSMRLHLSAQMVLGAKFLPPLRSAAYVIYGLQGTSFHRFLLVSLASSLIWVAIYAAVGKVWQGKIDWLMRRGEHGGRWLTVAEIALSVALVAAVWI